MYFFFNLFNGYVTTQCWGENTPSVFEPFKASDAWPAPGAQKRSPWWQTFVLALAAKRSLESLPPPCEITTVTFATGGREVREVRNAFLFFVLFARNTHRCLFLQQDVVFFFFGFSLEDRSSNNEEEHGIIKGSKTQSCCLQEGVAVNRWCLQCD